MDGAADALADRGWYSVDDFLAPPQLAALRDVLAGRLGAGRFRAARIGAAQHERPQVRGDEISWIDEGPEPLVGEVFERLEALRQQLNGALQLGLFDVEAHFARYAPGRRYERHVDRAQGSAARTLTFVLYLNRDWRPEYGGALRLHEAGGGYQDILPCGGRLVCFLTEGREHEVLPATRERLSLTGWMRRRDARYGSPAP